MNKKQIFVLLLVILVGAVPVGAVLAIAYTRIKGNNDSNIVGYRLYGVWVDKYRGADPPTNWYTIEELKEKYHIHTVSSLLAFFSPQYYNTTLVELELPLEFRDKICEDQPIFQWDGEFYQVTVDITKLLPDACGMYASLLTEESPWSYKLKPPEKWYTFKDFIKEFHMLTISPYKNFTTEFEVTFPDDQWDRLMSELPVFQYNGKFYMVHEAFPRY